MFASKYLTSSKSNDFTLLDQEFFSLKEMTLQDRLRQAFEELDDPKLRPADLARACDVTESTVSFWMHGRTKTLRGDNLFNAARFLKVSADWLATGRGPMHPGLIASDHIPEPNPEIDALLEDFGKLAPPQRQWVRAKIAMMIAEDALKRTEREESPAVLPKNKRSA